MNRTLPKNKRLALLFLTLLTALSSCKPNISEDYDIISNAQILEIAISINGQSSDISFLQPINLLFHENRYWIQDAAGNKVFTLVDPQTLLLDTLLGLKGNGPNEFNNNYMFLNNKTNKSSGLIGFNSIDKRFYEYSISKNPMTGNVDKTELIPITESFIEMQNMIQNTTLVNDGIIAYTDNLNEKLTFYTYKNKISGVPFSSAEAKLLNDNRDFLGPRIIEILPGFISSHTDRDEIVYANRNLGYLEVYSNSKSRSPYRKVVIGDSFKKRVRKLSNNLQNPDFHIIDLAASEDNIYVLYLGKSSEKAMSLDPSIHTSVLVFDYDLNLRSVYSLNNFIGTFAINEKQRELIGLNYGNEVLSLMKYDLPN